MSMNDERFDLLLWEMAHKEETPLPPGLDGRLEEIYARLEQEDRPQTKKEEKPVKRKIFTLARAAAFAAVVALMAVSMIVGALAFSTEHIVEVEIPVEPEIIDMGNSGLSIILPNDWKGKYVAWVHDDDCFIFEKTIWDACMKTGLSHSAYAYPDERVADIGLKFWVELYPYQITSEEFYAESPTPAVYLMCTEQGAFILHYPSDVQYPVLADDFPGYTQEQVDALREAYFSLYGDVQFVFNDVTIDPIRD